MSGRKRSRSRPLNIPLRRESSEDLPVIVGDADNGIDLINLRFEEEEAESESRQTEDEEEDEGEPPFQRPRQDGEEGEGVAQEEGPRFEPYPIETAMSRAQAAEEDMGTALPPWQCFGCMYQSTGGDSGASHAKLGDHQYEDLNDMIEKCLVNGTPIEATAKMVAEYYASLRDTCNAAARPGDIPLPPWNAATILEHIRYHLKDPDIWRIEKLEELQRITDRIVKETYFRREVATGQALIDPVSANAYKELLKCQIQLYGAHEKKQRMEKRYKKAAEMGARIKARGRQMYETGAQRPTNRA